MGEVLILLFCRMTNIEKAEEYFDKAISAFNLGDYKLAKNELENVIKIYPSYPNAYYSLATILWKYFKNFDEANLLYQKALKVNVNDFEAYNNLAYLHERYFYDYEKARFYYEKSIKVNPNYAYVHNNIAILLIKYFEEYDKARKYLEKAIELNKDYAKAYNNLAFLLFKKFNEYEKSQEYFMRAIEINSKYDLARKNLDLISNFKKQTFISEFDIKKVRHQKNLKISLSEKERKHLFLTGKNGSGKTSILKEIEKYLQQLLEISVEEIFTEKGKTEFWQDTDDYNLKFSVKQNLLDLRMKYEAGIFTIVFFGDERKLERKLEPVNSIEKIDFKLKNLPKEDLSKDLLKFLFWQDYQKKSNIDADQITRFFDKITRILKQIYKDEKLIFEPNLQSVNFGDSLNFTIELSNGNKFTLNEMAAGYSAIFEIIFELMLRMEAKPERENSEGIVLIDEPETHLHIEIQKEIMPILIELFPNVQFIVATHSPFILSSVSNAVIYDLENHTREEDFSMFAYDSIVEKYFENDKYSEIVKIKFNTFKELFFKKEITTEESRELRKLEYYFENIPSFVAPELIAEFQSLQLKKISQDDKH